MKFGLQIFTDYASGHSTAWEEIAAQARAAELSGFDGIFVPTDISWRRLDALSLIAALAGITRRVVIGTNVITLPLYAPLHVAEAVATADMISGGRVVLGVASGWRRDEFAAAGIPFEQRLGRLYEGLEVIKALWTQPEVTRAGKYFHLDRVALHLKPLQKPHPRIWIGAHLPAAVTRAGQRGYGWIEGPRTSMRKFLEKHRLYAAALAEYGGGVADVPLLREAFVAESPAQARDAIERPLLDKYAEYARQAGIAGKEDASFDQLAPGRFIVGSVEECRSLVAQYAEAGVNWLVMRMQYPGSDPQRVIDSIELFGREVAPRLRD